jgi:hypothetical protein
MSVISVASPLNSISCHVHSIIFLFTATASRLTMVMIPVLASFTMLLVTAKVVAPLVFSSFSCNI